jgi:hypothetical protein
VHATCAAVAPAVPIHQFLGPITDQCSKLGAVGHVEQGDIEAVRAVRGVGQGSQPQLGAGAQRRQPVVHATEVGVKGAARMVDRLGAVLAQPGADLTLDPHGRES